jgi:carbonic anhydrase
MDYSLSISRRSVFADLVAGLVVFLVALPLCLGIAQASNAPLFSGILAGVIGGIVVGMLSGSSTSVSGPAAGLTAVVIVQLEQLKSFEVFLLAVVVSGVLQCLLGWSLSRVCSVKRDQGSARRDRYHFDSQATSALAR